jgi:hypothetical protein
MRAPVDGVTGKMPNIGDYAHAGVPLMPLVAAQNAWVEANYKETAAGGRRLAGRRECRGRTQTPESLHPQISARDTAQHGRSGAGRGETSTTLGQNGAWRRLGK